MENTTNTTPLKKACFNVLLKKKGSWYAQAVNGYTFKYNGVKFGVYNFKKQVTEIDAASKNKYIIIELSTGLSIAKDLKFLNQFNVNEIFSNNHFEKCLDAIDYMKHHKMFNQCYSNYEYFKKIVNNYLE